MKKLHEVSAESELAVVKAMDGASLTGEEIDDLSALTLGDLMSDYDLDYILADRVKQHVEHEVARYVNQQTLSGAEVVSESVFFKKNSNPRFKRLTNIQVRKLVRHMINEELDT